MLIKEELKMVEFLKENELLYSKKLMNYKDPNKIEAIWDNFYAKNNIEKAECKGWFKSQRTMARLCT